MGFSSALPLVLCLPALGLAQMQSDTATGQRDSTVARPRKDSVKTARNEIEIPAYSGGNFALDQIGRTRIVLRDGTMKIACTLKEIHPEWIIYEKNGGLHDLMIDRILRIETPEGPMGAIVFDRRNRPRPVARDGGR